MSELSGSVWISCRTKHSQICISLKSRSAVPPALFFMLTIFGHFDLCMYVWFHISSELFYLVPWKWDWHFGGDFTIYDFLCVAIHACKTFCALCSICPKYLLTFISRLDIQQPTSLWQNTCSSQQFTCYTQRCSLSSEKFYAWQNVSLAATVV